MIEEEVKLFVKDVDNRIPRLELEAHWHGDATLLMSIRLWWPRPRICSSGVQMKKQKQKPKKQNQKPKNKNQNKNKNKTTKQER